MPLQASVRAALLAGATALAACGSPSSPVMPPATDTGSGPTAAAPAVAVAATPVDDAADAGPRWPLDATTAADALPWEELLSLVATSPDRPFAVAAFPDGALVAMQSFLALVAGAHVVQDPALLAGLPEYVNWDADSSARLPRSAAALNGELPKGAFLSIHAGNRHGVGGEFVWNGRRWTKGVAPRDPRIASRGAFVDALEFSDGTTLLVEEASGGAVSLAFDAGAALPAQAAIPLERPFASVHALAGASLHDAYLCTPHGTAHFDGRTWSSVPLPRGLIPSSCAVTRDGALWLHDLTFVYHRTPQGEWRRVALPRGGAVASIDAAGDRVWIGTLTKSGYELWSTAAVTEPVEIDAATLPSSGTLADGGITGLDADVPDLPSLSSDPPGPGTAACRAPVVYLGRVLTSAMRRALAGVPEARSALTIEARGRAKGGVTYRGATGAYAVHLPSTRAVRAFALIPESYAQGRAIVQALAAKSVAGLEPKLLCALPEVVRKLGPR